MPILVILLIISILWGLFQKLQFYAMVTYLTKKEYTPPSDDEVKECIRFVLEKVFKA